MVSVVIPTYNAGRYLMEAVDSVLRQNTDKEIVIVNDCSRDGSVEVMVEHLKNEYGILEDSLPDEAVSTDGQRYRLSRNLIIRCNNCVDDTADSKGVHLRIYDNVRNLGVAAARSTGVCLAEGEYIAFLDADDRWCDGKLSRQIRMLEKTGAVLCNTARQLINPDGSSAKTVIDTPARITLKQLEKTNYINCSSVLIRRETALKYPMEHSDAHEDYLTWLRILKEYDYAVGINEPLIEYRLTAGGKSRNKLRAAKMTYITYRYAGYGRLRAAVMMIAYTWNGIRKYKFGYHRASTKKDK